MPGCDRLYFGVDESAEYALAGDSDAYLMVRFTRSPPTSWKALHLNEYALTEAVTTPSSPSLASDLFWDAMARVEHNHCAVLRISVVGRSPDGVYQFSCHGRHLYAG
ncbi:MAG TPA: hypothetical protein EYQ20_02440 [candidate division Zixibacteria bacterium]|nr:hypothetical protein [candidate division Zixibacteria bacterium]